MDTFESALTVGVVGLFVIAVLLAYVLMLSRRAATWRDNYYNELSRHDMTRETLAYVKAEVAFNQDDYARNLKALQTAHAELQAAFLEQGRQLTIAEACARAAERELA